MRDRAGAEEAIAYCGFSVAENARSVEIGHIASLPRGITARLGDSGVETPRGTVAIDWPL
jgi:hypothetical protein